MDRKQSKMAELVIWSPGAAVLAVLRGESWLRKQQKGVRKESMAELMPPVPASPVV